MVQSRLIQHRDAQVFLGTIGLGHLQEGVHFTHRRDVVGDEGLELSFEVDLLRLVAVDVLEDILHLLTHWQIRILRRVVGARNFLLLVVFVVIVALLARSLLGLALLGRQVASLGQLLLLLDSIHIYLVVFLVAFDFLGVIYFHRQVKRLILHLFSLDCATSYGIRFGLWLGVGGLLLLHGHWRVVVGLILFFFRVELVSNF